MVHSCSTTTRDFEREFFDVSVDNFPEFFKGMRQAQRLLECVTVPTVNRKTCQTGPLGSLCTALLPFIRLSVCRGVDTVSPVDAINVRRALSLERVCLARTVALSVDPQPSYAPVID